MQAKILARVQAEVVLGHPAQQTIVVEQLVNPALQVLRQLLHRPPDTSDCKSNRGTSSSAGRTRQQAESSKQQQQHECLLSLKPW